MNSKHPPGEPTTLGNMRELGVRRLLVSCINPECRHDALLRQGMAVKTDGFRENIIVEPTEEFIWIATYGDIKSGMRMHFGKSIDDPIPFILTVTPRYVAHQMQTTLPLKIQELQHYCKEKREELRKIALNCKQRGLNAEVLM